MEEMQKIHVMAEPLSPEFFSPHHVLLQSDTASRRRDSMQSTALIWVDSLEFPMPAFCTHLLLP